MGNEAEFCTTKKRKVGFELVSEEGRREGWRDVGRDGGSNGGIEG